MAIVWINVLYYTLARNARLQGTQTNTTGTRFCITRPSILLFRRYIIKLSKIAWQASIDMPTTSLSGRWSQTVGYICCCCPHAVNTVRLRTMSATFQSRAPAAIISTFLVGQFRLTDSECVVITVPRSAWAGLLLLSKKSRNRQRCSIITTRATIADVIKDRRWAPPPHNSYFYHWLKQWKEGVKTGGGKNVLHPLSFISIYWLLIQRHCTKMASENGLCTFLLFPCRKLMH